MATTTGFVQRLTLLSDSKLVCAWIGPAPDLVEAFFVIMTPSDSQSTIGFKQSIAGLLTEAQLAGRSVGVGHDANAAEITSIYTAEPDTSVTPLQLDAIEITQAVQDLAHSIPLLAGKRTVVRLYLSYYSTSTITVLGEISISRSPSDPPLTISSDNAVVLDPAQAGDIPSKRENATRSLNFVLPLMHIAEGPLSIRIASITDAVSGDLLSMGNERRPAIWLHETTPLRIRVMGMRYSQGTPPVTHTPTILDFNLLISWLGRAYPVGQVINSTAIMDVTEAAPFSCVDVNAQLAAIRTLDMDEGGDERTHYYGIVSDGGFFMRGCAAGVPQNPSPDTVSCGPTGSGTWGWDFDGSYGDWYGGHELGHTFGRRHPGFCGESQSDLDNYPFQNGQLANSGASFVGFDVGDPVNGIPMVALPGTQWHDFMTYCDFQWSSAYSYLGVRRRLAAEDQMALGARIAPPVPRASGGRPDQRFPHERILEPRRIDTEAAEVMISLVANVNLTKKEGKIKFVNPLKSGVSSEPEQGDMVLIRIKDGDGQMLHEYQAGIKFSSELLPTEDRVGIVAAVIPVSLSARSIELVLDGREVVDTIAIGTVTAATGAQEVRGKTSQTFSVQVSSDAGKTWQTAAIGLKTPSFTLDQSQFRAGELVEVRIVTTDGLVNSVVSKESVRIRHPS